MDGAGDSLGKISAAHRSVRAPGGSFGEPAGSLLSTHRERIFCATDTSKILKYMYFICEFGERKVFVPVAERENFSLHK